MIAGFDGHASYFSGWDDLPALWLEVMDPAAPPAEGNLQKDEAVCIAAAGTVGNSAVWFEGALKIPEHLPELEQPGAWPCHLTTRQSRLCLARITRFPMAFSYRSS